MVVLLPIIVVGADSEPDMEVDVPLPRRPPTALAAAAAAAAFLCFWMSSAAFLTACPTFSIGSHLFGRGREQTREVSFYGLVMLLTPSVVLLLLFAYLVTSLFVTYFVPTPRIAMPHKTNKKNAKIRKKGGSS